MTRTQCLRTGPAYVETVQRWWVRYFGGSREDYGVVSDAFTMAANDAFGTVITDGTTICGGIVGTVLGPDELSRWIKYEPATELFDESNGYVTFVFTRPGNRHSGVATRLLSWLLGRFSRTDTTRIFALSWQRNDHPDSTQLFESADFDERAHINRYYARFDERPDCPDCWGPCECDTKLMMYTGADE